jgi:hypothetical protein
MDITLNSPLKSRTHELPLAKIASLDAYRRALDEGASQRNAAEAAGLPRMTLVDRNHPRPSPYGEATLRFLETPEGASFLQFIVLSVAMAFVVVAGVGLPTFLGWLRDSKLDLIFASSNATWRKIITDLENATVAVASMEQIRLAPAVHGKEVTIALDETWLKRMLLVCGDAVSGFLFFEKYRESRSAESWNEVWKSEAGIYNLKVLQGVADAGTGLTGFLENSLGAHRSPDLFHIENDLCKALARFLAGREKRAQDAIEERKLILARLKEEAEIEGKKTGPGRRRDLAKAMREARGLIASAHHELEFLKREREKLKLLLARMSDVYTPIFPNGDRRSASYLETELRNLLQEFRELADRVHLPVQLTKYINKAERQIPAMVETLAFWSSESRRRVSAFARDDAEGYAIHAYIITQLLLETQAGRTSGDERLALMAAAERLRERAQSTIQDEKRLQECYGVAKFIADLWQRSSSAIEGRNGLLSQRHHGLRGISERKLKCLTALHNFHARRSDGTTAAERFFGRAHADIFQEAIARCRQIPLALRKQESIKNAA